MPIGERTAAQAWEMVQQADEIEKEALLSGGLDGGQVSIQLVSPASGEH